MVPAQSVSPSAGDEYRHRISHVEKIPGFVALWDFVKRDPQGRFAAYQAPADRHDFSLDAMNYVREYWGEGRAATYDDFPLLGRGPFGQAVLIRQEKDSDFRPVLIVPRERLHDSGLDVKGPSRSVSMVVWLIRESGNHAIAGIWHEGTDTPSAENPAATRVERGTRQYALFAGLGANPGAVAAHVSENGGTSFGDKYARNLAVTAEVIPAVPAVSPADVLDKAWATVGFSFDNGNNTVTAYFNGKASDFWIDNPAGHRFFRWPYQGWLQADLRRRRRTQLGEDRAYPPDQFYAPPQGKPLERKVVERHGDDRLEMQRFAFTKIRVLYHLKRVVNRDMVALRVNPFWFAHDLYAPKTVEDGGPFTIGRVIHSSRSVGFTGYIGGVAVFDRPLGAKEMEQLAAIGALKPISAPQ